MSWVILIASGVLEAVWASALSASRGFTQRTPTIVFAVALVLSMGGLAVAMNSLPTGTSYAIWVGIGASLTVTWAMLTRQEPISTSRVLLICVLVASVVGLKAVS